MKLCPNCNNENDDNVNHCINCGYSFIQQESTLQKYNQQELSNNVGQTQANPTLNNPNINQYDNTQQYNNNQQYTQQSQPFNKKSKIIGLILNILVVGLGYAYVGKWGEGLVLLALYLLMWILGFFLLFPWIIALALWIYSLIKTNNMIDNYNNGLPY